MITTEQIAALATSFEIDQFSVLREYLQVLFLTYLSRSPDAMHIYFKGGTALRLLLHSFRFSSDLDFTTTLPPHTVTQRLQAIVQSMAREVPSFQLVQVRNKRSAITAHLRYTSPEVSYPLVIHLECSIRERPLTSKTTLLETQYPISPYPWVMHLDWSEILAEKVRALMMRVKGRDLFDLWYLLTKGVELNWKLVNKKMILYHQRVTREDLLQRVRIILSSQLKRDLTPFLPRSHRQLPMQLQELTISKLSTGE